MNTLLIIFHHRANLSHDYFTNRQDRYVVFEDCEEICNYFEDLVKTVSRFSFALQPDDSVNINDDFPYHPYNGSKRQFNAEAGKLLKAFTEKYAHKFKRTDFLDLLHAENTKLIRDIDMGHQDKNDLDTLVFPLLQMRTMGIQQDELVTRNIIATAPKNTNLLLATAYFNLTNDYWNAILKTKPNVDIIMAHPKAMGFYKASGMAGKMYFLYSFV